jgi:hypothetical protein
MTDERDITIDDLDVTEAEAAEVEGGAFKSVSGLKSEAEAYQKEPSSIEIPN